MSIGANDIKDLREKTGAGMMDCKKALNECGGDMEKAIDYLRAKGLAAAQKKQTRVAAEGAIINLVEGSTGILVEINCETDFVAKGDDFRSFANSVAGQVLKKDYSDVDALKDATSGGANELTLKCGEKIDVRRFVKVKAKGIVGSYNHNGKIGVLVDVSTTGNAKSADFQELVKDVSMHVAAAAPRFLKGDDIDDAFKKREADIYTTQLKEEGKPDNMIGKIVEGKLKKLASDVCLLEQKFVKNPDISVEKHVKEVAAKIGGDIKVNAFYVLNLGDGIEKRKDNLAEEVAKMTGR